MLVGYSLQASTNDCRRVVARELLPKADRVLGDCSARCSKRHILYIGGSGKCVFVGRARRKGKGSASGERECLKGSLQQQQQQRRRRCDRVIVNCEN